MMFRVLLVWRKWCSYCSSSGRGASRKRSQESQVHLGNGVVWAGIGRLAEPCVGSCPSSVHGGEVKRWTTGTQSIQYFRSRRVLRTVLGERNDDSQLSLQVKAFHPWLTAVGLDLSISVVWDRHCS
jgi:hypothetical protein